MSEVIDAILAAEGGYSDHPDDAGGPTMYGITQAVARAHGYAGEMRDLPEALARSIYENRYIVEPGFDLVSEVDASIASELIDTGVNMGPHRASEFLQRLLNVMNLQGSRYADVPVDGRIGSVTVAALRSYLAWRGDTGREVMLKALNCLQGARYIEIAEANSTQEAFIYGWLRTRVSL